MPWHSKLSSKAWFRVDFNFDGLFCNFQIIKRTDYVYPENERRYDKMHAEIFGKDGDVLQTWSTVSNTGDPYNIGDKKLEFKTNGVHFINRIDVWWEWQYGQIVEMTVTFVNEY